MDRTGSGYETIAPTYSFKTLTMRIPCQLSTPFYPTSVYYLQNVSAYLSKKTVACFPWTWNTPGVFVFRNRYNLVGILWSFFFILYHIATTYSTGQIFSFLQEPLSIHTAIDARPRNNVVMLSNSTIWLHANLGRNVFGWPVFGRIFGKDMVIKVHNFLGGLTAQSAKTKSMPILQRSTSKFANAVGKE